MYNRLKPIFFLELINPIQTGYLLDWISLALSAPVLFFPEKRLFSLEESRLISRTAAGNGAQAFIRRGVLTS